MCIRDSDSWVEGSTRPGEYHYYPFIVEKVGLVTVRVQMFCGGHVALLDADLIEWDEGYFNGTIGAPETPDFVYYLDPGVYSLREISTLPNNILDPKEYHIEVFPGENSTKTLSNDVRPNLYIHKRDAATGDPIPGTVYLVKAADGHTIDQVETDETGTAVVENLLPMVVEIVEVSVPEPYLLAEESQFTTLYPNEDSHVYFENSTRPVIEILKRNEITQDPLENVPVQVWYASNNTATGEYNDLGVFYTDSEGRIVLSDPDPVSYTHLSIV